MGSLQFILDFLDVDERYFGIWNVTLAIGVILLLFFLFYKLSNRGIPDVSHDIPGPREIISEQEVNRKEGGGLSKYVIQLHEKYGPIVSFTIGSLKMVSIGDPELFRQHQSEFDRPVELFMKQIDVIGIVGRESIQITNGIKGQDLHRKLSRPFSFAECQHYYPELQKVGRKFLERLEALPPQTHIPIQENMLILTVKEVAFVSFGFEFDDDEIAKKQIKNYENAFLDVFYGIDDEIEMKEQLKKEGIADYRQFVQNAIDHRLKNRHLDDKHYFVDELLVTASDDDQILDNAVTFFTGAFHTTANLMTWLLYYLAEYQEIQDRVRSEFEEVLQEDEVTHQTIQRLKYLRQVIDEALRHSTLAPLAARCSSKEIKLNNYVIPANTPVIHSFGRSLTDPAYWPEPDRFDPERFSPENSKNRPSLAFTPFGFAGKRICPGYRFAYVVVAVLLSLILRKFRVRLAEGQKVQKRIGFVTQPEEEIWMTIEPLRND